jgi:hypothetical protein
VTSVTAHQIRQASKGSDDSFRIDGKDVHHVVIMGVVRTFEQRETKFTCTVEDHTGARAGAGTGRGQLRDSPSANHLRPGSIDLTHWTNTDGGDDLGASIRCVDEARSAAG